MYYNIFEIEFGCHNCRNVTPNGSFTFKTDEKLENLSFEKAKSLINKDNITCPACGKNGECEVFSIEFENYIYDFLSPSPNSGAIQLEGSKRNGSMEEINMKGTSQEFAVTDYLNSIKYFKWYLEELNKNSNRLNNEENGNFFFHAYYSMKDVSPIAKLSSAKGSGEIVVGTGSVGGFSYEEVRNELNQIERELEKKFQQRMN